MKTKKVTILDWDEATELAIKKISKGESKKITQYMLDGLEGSYYDLYVCDEEDSGMTEKEADAYKRFYNCFKKFEVKDGEDNEFDHITFDCMVYS
jgi:hypothetical protein